MLRMVTTDDRNVIGDAGELAGNARTRGSM
jgi:hypothetical protein